MPTLVLLRHGESVWNKENRFTGWYDAELSEAGEAEAAAAGAAMKSARIEPDVVHTSVQVRSILTAELALASMGRSWLPVRRSWRLNERHYGDLQGLDKAETAARYGADQVKVWRRSYDIPPPPLDPGDDRWAGHDQRYAGLAPDQIPATECLADVVTRLLPYWHDCVCPDLSDGRQVLVVAHGNSLRALVMHLDLLSPEEIVEVNIPTGIPLRYELDPADPCRVLNKAYLADPEAVRAKAEAVARQAER